MTAVRSRLDVPTALGYSSAGTVIEVAPDVVDISVGDRIACAARVMQCMPNLPVCRDY